MVGRRWAVWAAIALVGISACSAAPVPRARNALPAVEHQAKVTGAFRVPILTYHHVGPAARRWRPLYVGLPQFARQMAAIARSGATSLTIDQLHDAAIRGRSFPNGAVALTFDDGTSDQYDLAFPVLRQYRLRATFYVSPGLFGKPGYISWAQARAMLRSGLIAFESHTNTHADLTRISADEAHAELAEGIRLLERNLGVRSRHFAYPYGHYDDGVVEIVRSSGFVTGVTTTYSWSHARKDALTWGRMMVHETNKPENLATLARSSGMFVG